MENKTKSRGHHEFLKDLDLTLEFDPTIQAHDRSFFKPFSQAHTAPTKKSKKTEKI